MSNCGYRLFQKKKKPKQKPAVSVCPEEAEAKDSEAAGQESPCPVGRKRRRHGHKVGMETVAGVGLEKVTTVSPPCVIQNTVSWLRPLSLSLSPSCFTETVTLKTPNHLKGKHLIRQQLNASAFSCGDDNLLNYLSKSR